MQNWNKVVLALDVEDPNAAISLIDTLDEKIQCFKLGTTLCTLSGPKIIRYLQQKNKKIFLDLKLYDTPRVVADTVKQFADLGVHYATLHCLGGREMLRQASQACRNSTLKLLGVTLLTSQKAADSHALIHHLADSVSESDVQMVEKLSLLALECRLAGVLCSAHELTSLKKLTPQGKPSGFLYVVAGIRPKNQAVFGEDQARIETPQKALELGADYIVVGRPVLQSRDPLKSLSQIFDP